MPLFIIIAGLIISILTYIVWIMYEHLRKYRHINLKQNEYLKKYRPIINIDRTIKERNIQKDQLISQIKELQTAYTNLKREHDIYYDDVEMISHGHYTPHYDFEDSTAYKNRLTEIRNKQKQLIKNKKAIVCNTHFITGSSTKEVKNIINKTIKLGLNAFNVQSDNAILKVTFNNVMNSKEKLRKIRDNINKLLKPNYSYITNEFFQLKIEELHLAYEYEEKRQEEREEQRQIKKRMREEEKLRKETEQAKIKAQEEEDIYTKAFEEARQEAMKATADQKSMYETKLKELRLKIEEAHAKKERAISMAQKTRQGHVYVISNIGSFGENIYKIGMTRRLEPLDRVKELGDSSVPFEFDIHAMIHAEDAPHLEKKLHESFNKLRMNRVNNRKEFFKLNLEEIENKCKELGINIQFTKLAKAREYRETLSIINNENSDSQNIKDSTTKTLDEILKKVG